jgi:hypothetical protein
MATTFPIDVTVDRLVEFHGLADALCHVELGRLPSHTPGDPVAEIICLQALQGQTGEQIQAWLHAQPEAVAYRTKPEHFDPYSMSREALLAIRGALFSVKAKTSIGVRPGQVDNIASTGYFPAYGEADRTVTIDAYKARGYTHGPVGPFIDPGYHGQFQPVDFRDDADRDRVERALQAVWDAGLIPVVFVTPDGWTVDQLKTLEPIYRSETWQRLCRIVCNGFEQQGSKYGWSNQQYVEYLSWLRDVFPTSIRLLHTVADIEAPVGNGDDTSKPGMSNGECWGRVTPLIHGWLHQSNALFTPNHVDPGGDGRTDEAHWYDLWDASKPASLVSRFRHGVAGWPTTSANGGPLKVYAGEFASFAVYWQNASEDVARDHGAKAVQLGADGSLDGWRA